jgi:hypothetical protein
MVLKKTNIENPKKIRTLEKCDVLRFRNFQKNLPSKKILISESFRLMVGRNHF